MRRSSAGFTLIELLAVIAVMGVLLMLAIPGFGYLAASTRVKNASTEVYLGLIRARNEAVKRNRSVAVVAAAGGWQNGWQIVADNSRDGSYDDLGDDPDDDRLIAQQGPLARVTITNASSSVEFRPTGRISGVAPAFSVTAENQDLKQNLLRCVRTDLTGRPFVKGEACS